MTSNAEPEKSVHDLYRAGDRVVWVDTGERGRVIEDRSRDTFVAVQSDGRSDYEWAAPAEIRKLSIVELIGEIPAGRIPPEIYETPGPPDPEGRVREIVKEDRESGW